MHGGVNEGRRQGQDEGAESGLFEPARGALNHEIRVAPFPRYVEAHVLGDFRQRNRAAAPGVGVAGEARPVRAIATAGAPLSRAGGRGWRHLST